MTALAYPTLVLTAYATTCALLDFTPLDGLCAVCFGAVAGWIAAGVVFKLYDHPRTR